MAAIDVEVVAIFTLLLALLGWGITYYRQRKIINKQTKAYKDLESLNAAQEAELRERELKVDILPELRYKMVSAYRSISSLGRRTVQHPDFEALTGSHLNDWMARLDFTDSEKEELLHSRDRKKYFLETQFQHDERKAQDRLAEFHRYLLDTKEKIDPELFFEFGKLEYLFNQALKGISTGRRSGDALFEFRSEDDLAEQAPQLMESIEEIIRMKLNHYSPPTA